MDNTYIGSIEQYSEADWLNAVESIADEIHDVDRDAVQIWFRFYPLDLVRWLESADDLEHAKSEIKMLGDFGLYDKIDTSHHFLYGHRFWPHVRTAIIERADDGEKIDDLAKEIGAVARAAAAAAKADVSLTLGIAAAGLMTLVQTGLDELKAAKGVTVRPAGVLIRSPDAIVAERAKDDNQGIFGFLRTINKEFSVVHDEYKDDRFKIINDEAITSASQKDRSQDWQSMDERCWEGPVPIECTAASCGTCWIGVLGGKEKLSSPAARERRAMKAFGYNQPGTDKPFMRLACQARAHGNVTIVVPEWNAVFGKRVRGDVGEIELEPVTTSAKKLRETIASAVAGSEGSDSHTIESENDLGSSS